MIRIFAGNRKTNPSPEDSHKLMVKGIEECCMYAGEHGVHLALENHGGPTVTADGLLKFVQDVQSPWFGVNLDTGNFYTDDPYRDLEKVAPYAVNVQVKVVTATDKQRNNKQPTDFKRLANILDDVDYRGFIVLEHEEGGDPRQKCEEYVDRMKVSFRSV